jgi:hypothetical protein
MSQILSHHVESLARQLSNYVHGDQLTNGQNGGIFKGALQGFTDVKKKKKKFFSVNFYSFPFSFSLSLSLPLFPDRPLADD